MMIKNKRVILFLVIFLLIVISIGCLIIIKKNKDSFLFRDKEVYDVVVDYEKIQDEKDLELIKYVNNKRITMNNPKVILNPYDTSPLTALAIFYTKDKTAIKLYINSVFMTIMEESNSHIIPIYGLRENYNNEIKIVDNKGNEKVFYIKTEKLKDSDFYTYNSTYDVDEYLFINSPKGKYAIDNDGYITWYRDINYNEMDLSFDKRIYFVDKYYRIIETDFLGRVYRMYYTDTLFNNHKIKRIKNGNLMVLENFSILEIRYDNGEVLYSINLLDILRKVDEEIDIKIDENYINYFQYNDADNTLVLSIRGIDAIINYDLSNEKIIWLLSNNEIFSSKFDEYKLKLTSGSYFKGQHTPYLDGNKLYVFDNNNFAFSNHNYYLSGKSSAVIYEINGMNITEVYRYKSDLSSGWYGSFYEKNDIKTINFGCVVNSDVGNYSKVIELNKDNEIVTELTTSYDDLLIYESFRDTFYNEFTPNYLIDIDLVELKSTDNGRPYYISDKKSNYTGFKEGLENAIIDDTLIEYSSVGIAVNAVGKVDVLYVSEDYDYYELKLEFTEETAGLYHYIWTSLINIRGKYAVYVKINDKYYNTNIVFNVR